MRIDEHKERELSTINDAIGELAEALAGVIEKAVLDAVAKAVSVKVDNDSATLLSVPEAAGALGLGTTTVKKLIAAGELTSVTVGRRRLVPRSALEDFTKGRT